MKKTNLLLATTLGLGLLFGGTVAKAETKAVDEMWGNPTFIYGKALDNKQLDETKEILEIKDTTLDESAVDGKDLVKYLGEGNEKANMYSSALITKAKNNKGIVVQIVTPDNITKVTSNQYTNALITAGAENVDVKVASPIKVTGESALTGIYKAYEVQGQELDTDRMKVAQEELSTVTDIVDKNKENPEFNEEALNNTLIDIKTKLAETSKNGLDEVPEKVARTVVNQAIKQNGLDAFITPEQVDSLVDFAFAYSKTGAVSSDAVTEQLDSLASDVKEKAKEFGDKFKDTITDEGFWQDVKNFFSNVIESIANWFK